MPYILKHRREDLDTGRDDPETAGELNYELTQWCLKYLYTSGISYQSLNDVIGALEGAKQEFYRRVVVPYEEMKSRHNGDVYANILSQPVFASR